MYAHFPMRRSRLPPRQRHPTELAQQVPNGYPCIPPLELSSVKTSSYLEIDQIQQDWRHGNPQSGFSRKAGVQAGVPPLRFYEHPSNSDRSPQKCSNTPTNHPRKDSSHTLSSSQSAAGKLERMLFDKHSECRSLSSRLEAMQKQYEARIGKANEDLQGLLEEVKGLTDLNILLDTKVRHMEQQLRKLEEEKQRHLEMMDDPISKRMVRLRQMEKLQRASAESLMRIISQVKGRKAQEKTQISASNNSNTTCVLTSDLGVQTQDTTTIFSNFLPQNFQSGPARTLREENRWLSGINKEKDCTIEALTGQVNRLKGALSYQVANGCSTLTIKSKTISNTTISSSIQEGFTMQSRIRDLEMQNQQLRLHKAGLLHIERSYKDQSSKSRVLMSEASCQEFELQNEALRLQVSRLMHSNNIVAREYNNIVEVSSQMAHEQEALNDRITHLYEEYEGFKTENAELRREMALQQQAIMEMEKEIEGLRRCDSKRKMPRNSELSGLSISYRSVQHANQLDKSLELDLSYGSPVQELDCEWLQPSGLPSSPRSLAKDLQNCPASSLLASVFETSQHSPLLQGLAEFLSKVELHRPAMLSAARKLLQTVREHLVEIEKKLKGISGGVVRYMEEAGGIVSSFQSSEP